jgi:hypothetical protein
MKTKKMNEHPLAPQTIEKPELVVTPAERKMDSAHVPHLPGNAPFTPSLPVNSPTFAPHPQAAAAGTGVGDGDVGEKANKARGAIDGSTIARP